MTTLTSFTSSFKYLLEQKNHSIVSVLKLPSKAWFKGSTRHKFFIIIILSGLHVVEGRLPVFYGLLLNPGKTIINLIFLFGFTTYTTELKEPPGFYSLTTVIKAWKL